MHTSDACSDACTKFVSLCMKSRSLRGPTVGAASAACCRFEVELSQARFPSLWPSRRAVRRAAFMLYVSVL